MKVSESYLRPFLLKIGFLTDIPNRFVQLLYIIWISGVPNPESKSYQQPQPGEGDDASRVRGLFPIKSSFWKNIIWSRLFVWQARRITFYTARNINAWREHLYAVFLRPEMKQGIAMKRKVFYNGKRNFADFRGETIWETV